MTKVICKGIYIVLGKVSLTTYSTSKHSLEESSFYTPWVLHTLHTGTISTLNVCLYWNVLLWISCDTSSCDILYLREREREREKGCVWGGGGEGGREGERKYPLTYKEQQFVRSPPSSLPPVSVQRRSPAHH